MATLLSVQVGAVASFPPSQSNEAEWRSAIFKWPVTGPVMLGPLGLSGDEQADHRNHGGLFRAVNVYAFEHYNVWRSQAGLQEMGPGAFGENFTTQGLAEETVCIGDVYQVGDVQVQVSQPRGPCYKLNRRWQSPTLQQRVEVSGWTGWYLRVLRPGTLQAGTSIELVERPSPGWTIAKVWSLHRDPSDIAALRELVELPGLSPDWKESVRKKLP